jgi:hypothetical protein
MFLRSRLRTRVASLPILTLSQIGAGQAGADIVAVRRYFFLPAIGLAGPF